MTKAVAVKDDNAVEVWADEDWGDTGVDNIEAAFPMLRLTQAVSKHDDGKHGGEFYRTDTEEFYPEVELVALYRRETRGLLQGVQREA